MSVQLCHSALLNRWIARTTKGSPVVTPCCHSPTPAIGQLESGRARQDQAAIWRPLLTMRTSPMLATNALTPRAAPTCHSLSTHELMDAGRVRLPAFDAPEFQGTDSSQACPLLQT